MTLVENDWIVSDDIKMGSIFNYYSSNLVENLKFQVPRNLVNCSCQREDPILKTILKYQNHASITAIKEIHHMNHFSFKTAPLDDIKKELQLPRQSTHHLLIDSICRSNFPHNLQLVDAMPVYKKIIDKIKRFIVLLVPYQIYQKSLRIFFVKKY